MAQTAPPASTASVASPAPSGWWRWLDFGEPRLIRGPFARWPRAADAVLAVVVFAISSISVAASALDDGEEFGASSIGDVPIGAVGLLVLAAAALLRRRTRPIATAALVAVTMIVWAFLGYGDGHDAALIVALYGVGRYVADLRWNAIVVVLGAVVGVMASVIDTQQRVDVVPALLVAVLPWYVGRRVRNRGQYVALLRERAERLEADRHTAARHAVAVERARLARELHDVVAHRVSMMTVQAGAARTIAADDPETAVAAMGDVETAGREALGELRTLLGVLRTGDGDDVGPQPGLADVQALVADVERSGAEVSLAISGPEDDLPAAVDLSVYRIVQESLTNVVKHAGPEPRVEVTIVVEAGGVMIDVSNSSQHVAPALPGSGYGIAGMRERALLLGGTFAAGPEPPDRFSVRATLPFGSELT